MSIYFKIQETIELFRVFNRFSGYRRRHQDIPSIRCLLILSISQYTIDIDVPNTRKNIIRKYIVLYFIK